MKKSAAHFGLAFQIADDLGDIEQDKKNGRAVNFVLALGEEESKKIFSKELEAFRASLEALHLSSDAAEVLLECGGLKGTADLKD